MKNFVTRHVLWVGLFAVLIPLGVLLSLQYGWLVRLQQTSAIAETARLNNYLTAVSSEVTNFYTEQAWKALQFSGDLLRYPDLREVAVHHFRKKRVKGAKYLFLARYSDAEWSQVAIYDPRKREVVESPDLAAHRAVYVALAPWKTLAHSGATPQSQDLKVEERDPDNRIILKPITTDDSLLVGVAGMVIDGRYFENEVLPYAIKRSLPDFFEHTDEENLVVSVRDDSQRVVFVTGEGDESVRQVAEQFPFVFTDWTIGLSSRFDTPEQLARSNFFLNISISVLLALVLFLGVVFALRTASRQLKLSQMKSEFVSNVSHELRTPLASIRVFGELLRLGRAGANKDKAVEYGEYIETESRRLTQLINNILDFSKIESGGKTYQFQPANVHEILVDALKNLALSLKQRHVELIFEAPDEPMAVVKLDRDAITQAVANLVDNAVKYSNGASTIKVILAQTDHEVTISVRDEGIGISRDEQKKIFERFHRVSTGLVHDVKGSGLGLSIVNHVIGAHGGTVSVDSAPGRGSTFCISLPIAHPEPDAVDTPIPDRVSHLENN